MTKSIHLSESDYESMKIRYKVIAELLSSFREFFYGNATYFPKSAIHEKKTAPQYRYVLSFGIIATS